MDIVSLKFDVSLPAPAGVSASEKFDHSALWSKTDNLGAAFAAIARARGDYLAVETKSVTVSYAQMLRAAENVRRYLTSRADYKAGARVALCLTNSPEYIAAFYGILLADCVAVPLPHQMEDFRWRQIEESCSPDVLITRREYLGKNDNGAEPITLTLDAPFEGHALPAPSRCGNDMAVLLYTSGSTGVPKGVMLSHRNLLVNAQSILGDLPIRTDDRALVLLPLCYSFGNSVLQTHLLSGATLVIGGTLTFPATIVDAIIDLKATSFSAVPEVYGLLLKYADMGKRPMPTLRYMAVAGGGLRHDLALQVAEKIAPAEFHVMYGQSEASPRLASLPPDQLAARPGSIGRPLPGVELAVMDDDGRSQPPGEMGTLCARGENVMLGYWQDEALTADVLGPDGWLKTGDLAHRDADGYFYLDGRSNLLVKVQGYRVHPGEIESVVEAGFPHARAVALPMIKGEETRFALFLASQDHHTIDVAEVRAACLRELPPYKVPVHFEVLDRLPLTPAQKVDRAALSQRLPRN